MWIVQFILFLVVAGIGMAVARGVADLAVGLVLVAPLAALSRGRDSAPSWLVPISVVIRLVVAFLIIGLVLMPIAGWFAYNTPINVWLLRVAGAFIAFFGLFGEPPDTQSGAAIMIIGQVGGLAIYALMLFGVLPHLHVAPSFYYGL